MRDIIYIPIEVKVREFYSKLFFISRAVKKGHSCIIGDKQAIQRALNIFGPGYYFYKSMNFYDQDHILSVKNRKNIYLVQDEEAGYALNDNSEMRKFIKMRSSKENVELIDRFFSWGKFDHSNWIKAFGKYKKKFFMAGSPRIDIWRENQVKNIFKNEIEEIKNFKNYVLIAASGISSLEELKKQENVDKFVRKNLNENKKDKNNRKLWQLKIFKEMVSLTNYLAEKFPKINFIFRNHPGDNNENIQNLFDKRFKNIIVNNLYEVSPWIYKSKCVIHSCSTVGIQTTIMRKNLISYNSKTVKYSHRKFPNKFGITSTSFIDTKNKLEKMLKLKKKTRTSKIVRERFFLSEKKYCSDIILDNLTPIKISEIKKKSDYNILRIKIYF